MGAGGGYGMMLRRGTGGYYVNGVVARWPARRRLAPRRGDVTSAPARRRPDLATADLSSGTSSSPRRNGKLFQANTATPATQFSLDLTANSLTLSTATAASLFTAIPAVGAAPSEHRGVRLHAGRRLADRDGRPGHVHRRDRDEGRHVRDRHGYLGAVAPGGHEVVVGWTTYARN